MKRKGVRSSPAKRGKVRAYQGGGGSEEERRNYPPNYPPNVAPPFAPAPPMSAYDVLFAAATVGRPPPANPGPHASSAAIAEYREALQMWQMDVEYESTARRITMAAFNRIVEHIRIGAASQV